MQTHAVNRRLAATHFQPVSTCTTPASTGAANAAGAIAPRRYGNSHSDSSAAAAVNVPSHSTGPMPQPAPAPPGRTSALARTNPAHAVAVSVQHPTRGRATLADACPSPGTAQRSRKNSAPAIAARSRAFLERRCVLHRRCGSSTRAPRRRRLRCLPTLQAKAGNAQADTKKQAHQIDAGQRPLPGRQRHAQMHIGGDRIEHRHQCEQRRAQIQLPAAHRTPRPYQCRQQRGGPRSENRLASICARASRLTGNTRLPRRNWRRRSASRPLCRY